MRNLTWQSVLLLALPAFASAQTVHPAGAPLTTLNWQPASDRDELLVDVDGDNVADVRFTHNNQYPTAAGQSTLFTFNATPANPDTELALDSAEYDSAHRFLAGETIRKGLQWSAKGGYLAYYVVGNGGIGGRGFFRNATGYVAIRKKVADTWTYWWFNVTGGNGLTYKPIGHVDFYGKSVNTVLAAPTAGTAPNEVQVFPNPATNGWRITGNGRFQLFDSRGQLLQQGSVQSAATVGTAALAPGMYLLKFRTSTGSVSQHKLIRQ